MTPTDTFLLQLIALLSELVDSPDFSTLIDVLNWNEGIRGREDDLVDWASMICERLSIPVEAESRIEEILDIEEEAIEDEDEDEDEEINEHGMFELGQFSQFSLDQLAIIDY